MPLTQEDIKNLLVLIAVAPIKGSEATTVAVLQQKLVALQANPIVTKEEPKQETKND